MTPPRFLLADAVLFMHAAALREFGGLHGVRDAGLLDSALSSAENKLAHAAPGSTDLLDLAASYAFGIASNHAFNDGNKRTAWASCVLFLKANGVEIRPPAGQAVGRMVHLAEGALDETGFAAWLRTQAA